MCRLLPVALALIAVGCGHVTFRETPAPTLEVRRQLDWWRGEADRLRSMVCGDDAVIDSLRYAWLTLDELERQAR